MMHVSLNTKVHGILMMLSLMKYCQTRLDNMCTVMKCKVVLREYSFTVKDYEYLGSIASHSFPAAEDALQKACTSSFSLCINKFISWYLNSIEDWKCIYNFQQHIHLVSLTVLWEYQLRERSREVVISDSTKILLNLPESTWASRKKLLKKSDFIIFLTYYSIAGQQKHFLS